MMKLFKFSIIFILLPICYDCFAQTYDSTVSTISQLPDKYYSNIDHKLTSINDKLTKKSLKYLAKFQQHEKKITGKIR